MISTGDRSAPFNFVMSPTWSMEGNRFFVTSMGKVSISLAHTGLMPLRTAARGKPPIPSNRLPSVGIIHKPVKLIPEPNNPYDKSAIQVLIAGEFVGYVPREECDAVGRILKQHEVKYISAFISGGKYKIVSEDKDIFRDSNHHRIRVKVGYV